MAELPNLLKVSDVQIDLLLVLCFELLPATNTRSNGSTQPLLVAIHLLLRADPTYDLFLALSHCHFNFLTHNCAFLLERLLSFLECLHRVVHRVQLIQVGHCELVQTLL